MAAAVTTDEIYKRYLDKAIREILRLEHEVAEAADGAPVAQPTGHPLATIFLLKYGPQASGAAGGRRLPRPRRPRADQVARSGSRSTRSRSSGRTASSSPAPTSELSRAWLQRELRIVQPRLVVVMGDDALRFLNELEFPLSRPLEATLGELQRFTPTIEALVVPDIDLVARRAAREDSASGTPSSPSGRGGPSCRPTSARRRRSPRWYDGSRPHRARPSARVVGASSLALARR